ncbi:hypothetical protein AMATHDRAFT_11421 [Amanita thiersii Skay4041]|uniref:Uncharacterized protein n=1 Tax=Amanita thiersii Skay4041 TaxID=703135 RepID=A0A2A9NA58_9AGAR|nr:hypothetical protein AMATHDRAFT_11421 [Amanita thiersii Skay4041]
MMELGADVWGGKELWGEGWVVEWREQGWLDGVALPPLIGLGMSALEGICSSDMGGA